jgi:hypothetical protein
MNTGGAPSSPLGGELAIGRPGLRKKIQAQPEGNQNPSGRKSKEKGRKSKSGGRKSKSFLY